MEPQEKTTLEELSKNLNQKERELYLLQRIDEILRSSDSNIENILNKILDVLPEDWQYDNINIFLKKIKETATNWEKSGSNSFKSKEWRILIDLLKKIDMNLYLKIARKMMNYMCRIGIREAINLIQSYDLEKSIDDSRSIFDTNKPTEKDDFKSIVNISDVTFFLASKYVSDEEILRNIQRWIKEDKLSVLIQTLEKLDSSLTDIFDAITRYYIHAAEKVEFSPYLKINISALLINRFFTDQLDFINIAKNFVDLDDFYEILQRTVSPNNSHGKLGGKSAGLYLANKIIKNSSELDEYKKNIRVPKTWYVSSDVFQYFLYYNNLDEFVEQKYKDLEQIRQEYPNIIQIFKNSNFPPDIVKGLLLALEDFGGNPIIVRSSSLLEDRLGSAFSGKYKSLFLGNQGTKQQNLSALMDAIAEVYASLYGPDPMQYRSERGLIDFDEEMAVMIQEVVGTKVGKYFLPAFAGVAFSNNEFRWSPRIKRDDGLLRIVFGLGTRAVDRLSDDYPVLISPRNPNIRVNVSPDDQARYSPKKADVINLEENSFESIEISEFLRECGKEFPDIDKLISVVEFNNIRTKTFYGIDFEKDELIITLDGIFSNGTFLKQMSAIIDLIKEKIHTPVDLEFAYSNNNIYILQCRSQCYSKDNMPSPIPRDIEDNRIIFDAKKFVSNGRILDISHVVYVDPEKYSAIKSLNELRDVGKSINLLNSILPKKRFILMGPGRWGSRGDIKLGVNVTYSDINNTAMLIEIARKKGNYVPDLSFGTHFFQDLVESSINYLPLYPDDENIKFNEDFLLNSNNIFKDLVPEYEYLKNIIRVIDVPNQCEGKVLKILANAELDEAIAYIDKPSEMKYFSENQEIISQKGSEDYSNWQYNMIELIASKLDLARFGVKSLFIVGSARNITADPRCDIDFLVHFNGNESQKRELLAWFEGWSLCLSEMNYSKTGYKVENILHIHLVNDEDIRQKKGLAGKINAITDPARLLRIAK